MVNAHVFGGRGKIFCQRTAWITRDSRSWLVKMLVLDACDVGGLQGNVEFLNVHIRAAKRTVMRKEAR
jgi:hypothetical protein